MKPRSIQVCLSPALLPLYAKENTIAVVIDIFRATSSMCYGLANGAQAIIPVAEIEECLAYAGQPACLLAAERNGEVVQGFDFGNSPFSYGAENVAGKTVVLTTTNGTRAIRECEGTKLIAIGSFLNITALSDWLKTQSSHVLLVCAGWKDHVCMEDTLFAGAVVSRIKTADSMLDDAARIADGLYQEAHLDIAGYLRNAGHATRMERLNLSRDIEFCLRQDLVSVVPIMRDGQLVCL